MNELDIINQQGARIQTLELQVEQLKEALAGKEEVLIL